MMRAKAEGLVSAVGGATSKALAWAGPGFERPSGAMVIYCAGCFLATRPHISAVAESIRRGLSGGGDGGGGGGTPAVRGRVHLRRAGADRREHACEPDVQRARIRRAEAAQWQRGRLHDAPLSARELAGRSVSETAAIAAMREQAKQRGDAALVERRTRRRRRRRRSRGASRRSSTSCASCCSTAACTARRGSSFRIWTRRGSKVRLPRLSRAPHRAIGLPRERHRVGRARRVPRRRPGRHAELPRDLRAPPGGVAEGPPARVVDERRAGRRARSTRRRRLPSRRLLRRVAWAYWRGEAAALEARTRSSTPLPSRLAPSCSAGGA